MSDKELFPEYDANYSSSGNFPNEAVEQIPSELLLAIDAGNASFLVGMDEFFPKLYNVLTYECSRVHLLESISFSFGMDNPEKEYRTYCWGFMYSNKVISARIPVSNPSEKFYIEDVERYTGCLPLGFETFYRKMDGIGIVYSDVTRNRDLPSSFGDWRELNNFFEDENISSVCADTIYEKFPDSDLRVFIHCIDGSVVVCDLSGKSRSLIFIAADGGYKFFKVLERPVETLDAYFAGIIKGELVNIV